jgi:hypothetical protein
MAYGVTPQGFVAKRQSVLLQEYQDAIKAKFGQNANLAAQSNFGQLAGISTERLALIWELAEACYNARYPATAEGVAFDNVLDLSGLRRLKAVKSSASVYLFGDLGTLIPANSVISVAGNPLAKFETQQPVTLVAGANEVQDIAFSATPDSGTFKIAYNATETIALAFNASASAIQTALRNALQKTGLTVTGSIAAGLTVSFLGDTGLRPQPLLTITANSLSASSVAVTATVTQDTAGVAQGTVDVLAQATGPTIATAGTLTVIEGGVTGWASVENPLDAEVGRTVESDTDASEDEYKE